MERSRPLTHAEITAASSASPPFVDARAVFVRVAIVASHKAVVGGGGVRVVAVEVVVVVVVVVVVAVVVVIVVFVVVVVVVDISIDGCRGLSIVVVNGVGSCR